jgi:antitoxin VapB
MSEFSQKMEQLEALLDKHTLDAIVLRRVSSFAWATCGASSYINTATDFGTATLIIKRGERHLVTNRIEAPRLQNEEGLMQQGWAFHVDDWYSGADSVSPLVGARFGADSPIPNARDLAAEISRLRTILQPAEQERVRDLGRRCADAMAATIQRVQPGMSERDIAAALAFETESRGAQAIVNLIATDERIFNFRHPLPTDKVLDKYAMVVMCGRRKGLVVSVTRLVHFGPLPEELRRKASAVAQVDGTFINATRPGATLGEIFARAQAAYAADPAFANEWQLHHQGGPAGYEPRELVATPGSSYTVAAGQAYAWNPSITGAKGEDTMLVGESGNEVLTEIAGWPMLTIEAEGATILRPDILVQ